MKSLNPEDGYTPHAQVVLRFILVGMLNTAFGYGCYALLLVSGMHYAAAAFFSTVAGVTFNFFSSKKLVFRTTVERRLTRFIMGYFFIYIANVLILWILIKSGLTAYSAGLVLIIPSAGISFILQKQWVFRNE